MHPLGMFSQVNIKEDGRAMEETTKSLLSLAVTEVLCYGYI